MRPNAPSLAAAAAVLALSAAPSLAQDTPLTERNQTVESAVTTPVQDLNLKKTKIPDVLVRAQANPYDPAGVATCEALAAEVVLINAELGDDYDDVAAGEGQSKGISAGALLKAGVAQAIPFRGIVRQISGAAGHEREVEQAIDAGFARRGFLKGRAMEMNCAAEPATAALAPAAPSPSETLPSVEAATTATAAPITPSRPPVEASALPPIPGVSEPSFDAAPIEAADWAPAEPPPVHNPPVPSEATTALEAYAP